MRNVFVRRFKRNRAFMQMECKGREGELIVANEVCEFAGFEKVHDMFFQGGDQREIRFGFFFGRDVVDVVFVEACVGAGGVEDAETVV